MNRLSLAVAPLTALVAVLVAGCPGELQNIDRFACNVEHNLFKTSCTFSGCHAASNPAADLDLQSPGVVDRLVGKAASQDCPGILVEPQNPEGSILYRKLTPNYCGVAQMPLGRPHLSETQLACVRDWIEGLEEGGAGGKKNGSGGGAP